MGFIDLVEHLFAHDAPNTVKIGRPLALRDAKTALAMIAVHQPLADMRKVADAVRQLQDEFPQYATYGMTHYYNEPKRVRFQSEGGKFVDADAIADAFAASAILQDEITIQHLMGDIADNREHRDPAKTPAVPADELAQRTREHLSGTDDAARRAWLYALYDQLDDIDEATKGGLEPLRNVLSDAASGAAETPDGTDDAKTAIRARIVALLFPDAESAAGDAAHRALSDPQAETDDYMAAVQIFRDHGVSVPESVTLER
ncbi:hypothetical protein [Bifidobacterium biavatii]|uniref:Uncharacterized protein n=1 Tax=Bifidobacterium biavatii DSM 23969 TaxID=1437608 RepID=A0A086ZTE9_9BIFI|nr:hypothetical protein [Bifidobacterium biavatii]KFI49799.1 hypothetical protein BBIA_1489 [Bifidobacterium biavatii DSM 23969]